MSYNYTDKINNSSQLFFFLKECSAKMYRYIDETLGEKRRANVCKGIKEEEVDDSFRLDEKRRFRDGTVRTESVESNLQRRVERWRGHR